jgi:hypothetical protein
MFLAPLGYLVAIYPHIAAHELGHLLAALVMRLRVLGLRILAFQVGMARTVPASAGHVLVDVTRVRRLAPLRLTVLALAGPAVNLAGALVTARIALDHSAPLDVRYLAAGATVVGAQLGVSNLLPLERGGLVADGLNAWRWLRHTGAQRARIALAVDLAKLQTIASATAYVPGEERRRYLLDAVADPRPEVARAAMTELLRWRPFGDDGWQDVHVVAAFARRTDLAPELRARVSGNYAMSLAVAMIRSQGTLESAEAREEKVRRVGQLADLACAAQGSSLAARTARGLAFVLADQPARAQALLIDVDSMATDEARARAYVVRGLAEAELGDVDQAGRLLGFARRIAPSEPLVGLLGAVLSKKAST